MGTGARFCGSDRPADSGSGARFYASETADAYLQRKGPARGYSIVIFRGRHASDPIEFTHEELTGFWLDVPTAARMIDRAFKPCHINYQILGNAVPHVHAHITQRYLDDPAAERPLMFADRFEEVPAAEFAEQLRLLQASLR